MNINMHASFIPVLSTGTTRTIMEFEIGDMYFSRDPRSLKERSPNEASFIVNTMMIRAYKRLRFYTVGSYSSSSYTTQQNILFETKARQYGNFNLNILATAGNYNGFIKLYGCALLQSNVFPTTTGSIQTIEIKYERVVN